MIWGVAFVAQSAGMEYLGPFTYNGIRSVLGGLVLLPCIAFLNRMQGVRQTDGSSGRREDESEIASQGKHAGEIGRAHV